MRLGFSLCQEEVEFLQKRKVVVTKALSQVLQLEEDLHEDEVGQQGHRLGYTSPAAPCPTLAFPDPGWLLHHLDFRVLSGC